MEKKRTRREEATVRFGKAIASCYQICGQLVPPRDRIAMRAATMLERAAGMGFIPTSLKKKEVGMAKPSKKQGRYASRPGAVTWNDRRRQFQAQKGGRSVFNRSMISKRRKV